LSTFAKKKKLDDYQILKQAFDQNVLPEDNKELLLNFINTLKNQKNFQSQIYQDIFALLIIGENFDKTFLEFGATDGFELSNSYTLENNYNWKGVLSEPSPQWHESLKKNRIDSKIITECIWKETGKKLDFYMSDLGELSTLNDFIDNDIDTMPVNTSQRKKSGKIITVNTISLNDVIKEYFNNKCPSYISIDTEGSEYEILKVFNLDDYRPKLFTIEHNYTDNQSKLDELLISNGYVRIFKKLTAFDAWYIPLENL
jgi:FkbM family methyltransferase